MFVAVVVVVVVVVLVVVVVVVVVYTIHGCSGADVVVVEVIVVVEVYVGVGPLMCPYRPFADAIKTFFLLLFPKGYVSIYRFS